MGYGQSIQPSNRLRRPADRAGAVDIGATISDLGRYGRVTYRIAAVTQAARDHQAVLAEGAAGAWRRVVGRHKSLCFLLFGLALALAIHELVLQRVGQLLIGCGKVEIPLA